MSSSRAWIGSLRRGLPWFLALGVSWTPAVWADYQESYREGIGAVDRQNWAEVARYMQAAINENPREGENVRLYGVRFEVYLPYYYLGLAQYHLDNYQAAVAAWDVSESQGAVKGKQLRDLRAKREACRRAVAEEPQPSEAKALAEALRRAGKMLQSGAVAAGEISQLRGNPDFSAVFEQAPELAAEEAGAMDQLRLAQDKFNAGKAASDLAALKEAQSLAAEAESRLRNIVSQARTLHEQLEARRAEQQRIEEELPAPAREKPLPVPALPPSDDGERGGQQVGIEPRPGVREAPITELPPERVREQPSAPRKIEPSATPARLRSAAQAFFTADYNETLEILAATSFGASKAQAVGYLLSAAARYSLFLEGGRQDESLREAAAADVAACRQLDPAVRPDPAMFSPAFTRFFEAIP